MWLLSSSSSSMKQKNTGIKTHVKQKMQSHALFLQTCKMQYGVLTCHPLSNPLDIPLLDTVPVQFLTDLTINQGNWNKLEERN